MIVKLEDVCTKASSNVMQKNISNCIGEYKIFGASGYIGNVDFYHQEKPYVAVVKDGAGIGRTFLLPEKSSVIGTMQYLLPKDNVITEYLYYVVRFMHLEKYFSGATIPHIYYKDYKNETFNLVPINQQKNIVLILNKLDSVILKRQQQLEQFDLLIKSRFVEMFGDVISNEKKWNMSIWNDVLTIKNGRNQKAVENINGKYAICGSGGIMGYATDYITEANSVIIGRKGNINKPILMRERFWNVDTAFGLEPNQSINVEYLYMFCLLFDFGRLNKAVTIPSLTKADLLNIKMPIPPIELQNEFVQFVEQVEKSKTKVQKSLDEAQLLFDSLMQEYFG